MIGILIGVVVAAVVTGGLAVAKEWYRIRLMQEWNAGYVKGIVDGERQFVEGRIFSIDVERRRRQQP